MLFGGDVACMTTSAQSVVSTEDEAPDDVETAKGSVACSRTLWCDTRTSDQPVRRLGGESVGRCLSLARLRDDGRAPLVLSGHAAPSVVNVTDDEHGGSADREEVMQHVEQHIARHSQLLLC